MIYLNSILRRGWISVILWVILLAAAILTLPNIGQLERDKGANNFNSTYSSTIAGNILKKMDQSNHVTSAKTKEVDMVLVYYDKNTLSQQDKQNIQAKVNNLINQKSTYGVLTVTNLFADPDLADTYISKDNTTLLVPVTLDQNGRTVQSIRTDIMKIMKADGTQLYSTSGDLINEDFAQETQAGVKKTELITIIFIVAVLLLIFRSPITPFINLLSVGISFLVSLNITFQLVNYLNFPVSDFTEIFLVLILFGIGTDYTMLLLMRYKEELSSGHDKNTAILNTYKTAGKTIIFSSFTILIGFICLYFVQFKLYRSASAVAIGIVILDLVLFTFIPVLMKLFGKNLFWSPFKTKGHSENKVWGKVAGFSTKYPYVTIVITGLVCCLVLFYNGALSYNDLKEVAPTYPSIVGDNIVTKHFSAGESMPVTIAVKNTGAMNNQSDLAALDSLTNNLKKVKGVQNVYSVTQPKAAKIDDLYLNDQAQTLNGGLNSAESGILQIRDGLQSAISQLQSATQGSSSLGQLQSGTATLVSGLNTVTSSSAQLSSGLTSLKSGSAKLSSSLDQLESACGNLGDGLTYSASVSGQITQGINAINQELPGMQSMLNTMIGSYGTLSGDLTQMGNTLPDVQQNLTGAGTSLGDIGTNLTSLTAQLGGDPAYSSQLGAITADTQSIQSSLGSVGNDLTGIEQILTGLSSAPDESPSLSQAQAGLNEMSGALTELQAASSGLSSGLVSAADAQQQIISAVKQLDDGAKQLDSGLAEVTDGQSKMTSALSQLSGGAKQIQDGQNQLIDGVNTVTAQAKELTDGLSSAVGGLNQVSDGLDSANSYLSGLSGSEYTGSVFYIPANQIDSGDFVKSMNTYMSADRRITKFTVTLSVDPYSNEAMDVVSSIHGTVESTLKNSPLSDATYGISGITQNNLDLQKMSNADFSKARIIMLIGIFLVLLVITRRLWMPIFVLGSLVASYFISISLSGLFFHYALNEPELSWLVPFCSFVMIIALGVDYSIFLIMRHNENSGMRETDSIVVACRKVGGVITSAALILSGTFAAMYPSGVITLMELAVTVILGLVMLCFIFLPVAIPTLISLESKLESIKSNRRLERLTEEES